MRGLLSPPNPTPSSPVGGEVVYVSAPNPVCVEGFPGIPASVMLGSPKFGWLNTLKNWASTLSFTRSRHRKPFREIEVIPDEIGAAQGVAAEVSELAMLWVVATDALASARINGRNKRGRIEPLEGARLRYTGDGMMLIERDAGNRRWRTAVHCPAQRRFRWPNRACSERRTAPRCARTWSRKSASR